MISSPTLGRPAPDAALSLGREHHLAGRLAQARDAYRAVLGDHPEHLDALHLLGVIALQIGDLDNAGDFLRRAVAASPATAAFHERLGAVYQAQGRFSEALNSYCEATALTPDSAHVHTNLAVLLHRMGRGAEAVTSCRRALEIAPDDAKVQTNLAGMLFAMGEFDAAETACQRALELDPALVDACTNLGKILSGQGKFSEAIAINRKAIELAPDLAETHHNLGITLRSSGDLAGSLVAFEAAVELKPDYPEALNNMAIARIDNGRLDLALDACRRCLAANPDYRRAHGTLAMVLLALGDYETGFEEYEWRWRIPSWPEPPRAFDQPALSHMSAPEQTILVHCEQGYGDTLQFLRFACRLGLEFPGRVIFECPTLFMRLLAGLPGIDELVERATPLPPFDVHIPLLSLPRLFHATVETVSMDEPYLATDPETAARWRDCVDHDSDDLKVGLVWSSNVDNMVGAQKSIPLDDLRPLLGVPGTRFFSLQVDENRQDIAALGLSTTVEDLGASFADFADTAAVLSSLDLLISVDTAAAHLAGAMAIPVWTFLKYSPDWRWMLEREDSPWYPTMRLFRQRKMDDWAPVIEQVVKELAALAGGDPTRIVPIPWNNPPATRVAAP